MCFCSNKFPYWEGNKLNFYIIEKTLKMNFNFSFEQNINKILGIKIGICGTF